MKVVAALLLIALSVVTVEGDGISVAGKKNDAGGLRNMRRELGISDECLNNTEVLYVTPSLEAASNQWVQELETLEGECSQNGASGVCILDSKRLSSHQALIDACTEAGGTPALFTDAVMCDVEDGGSKAEATFRFVDIPECIASGCTEIVGQTLVRKFITDTAKLTEDALSLEFDSVSCRANSDGATTSLAVSLKPTTAVFGVVSAVLALLFL